MLYIGSLIKIRDNSGARHVKVINMRVKKTYTATNLGFSSICLCVVKKDKGNYQRKKKNLKKKTIINVMIACIKKKKSRNNGFYINFKENVGIPYENKNKRRQVFANRVFTPILKDLKKRKINKHIVLRARRVL